MEDADIDALASLRAQSFAARTRPAPFLAIDNFLPREVHDRVLADLIACQSDFQSNRMTGRDSLVLINPQSVQPVLDEIERRFDELITKLAALGAPVEDVTHCRLEVPSATATGHANFHAPHIDNDPLSGIEFVLARRVSFAWYAFQEPKAFEGGDLRLWDFAEIPSERGPWTPAATWADHACTNNSLLVFSSSSRHEVLPVRMFQGEFADRRFAVITAAIAS
jgi:hypothetical protein